MSVARQIRFDPEVWEMASVEAGHLGMSTAEFIRSAVLFRCVVSRLRRNPEEIEEWGEAYDATDLVKFGKRFLRDDPISPAEPEAGASRSRSATPAQHPTRRGTLE